MAKALFNLLFGKCQDLLPVPNFILPFAKPSRSNALKQIPSTLHHHLGSDPSANAAAVTFLFVGRVWAEGSPCPPVAAPCPRQRNAACGRPPGSGRSKTARADEELQPT